MTPEEVDRFVGQRVRIVRADGNVVVGLVELDSVAYVTIHGDGVTRSLRYEDIAQIEPAGPATPDTQ